MVYENPVYVMGGSLNALGIVKALGREKIPVFLVHHSKDTIASASRFAKFLYSPNPEKNPKEFLDFITAHRQSQNKTAVIIPTSDVASEFLSIHREALKPEFRFILADRMLIEKFVSKEGFDELSKKFNLPVPETFVPESAEDVERIKTKMDYPCIIKPFYSHKWRNPEIVRRYGWIKVLQINSPEELVENYRHLAEVDSRLVIQEYIHGGDDTNYSLHTYIPENAEKPVSFVGQKLRVAPIHYGVGACVRSVHEPEMVQIGERFLRDAGFLGMAVINFKKDPVREKIYAIELNPRFSLWNYLDYSSGINFAYLYYLDALKLPFPHLNGYLENVKWISIEKDISAFFSYLREGEITFGDWRKSYSGKKAFAEFSFDDPGPFVKWAYRMGKIAVFSGSRKILRKVFK